MIEWDKVLSWQAEMTDALDRAELEIRAFQSMEKLLLAHREQIIQEMSNRELDMIDFYLAQVNIMLKLKTLLVRNMKLQFRTGIESLQ